MNRAQVVVLLFLLLLPTVWAADTPTHNRDSYLQKAEKEVQEWTVKLKSLQERSEKSGVKTRDELNHDIKLVNDHLEVARKQLGIAKSSGDSGVKNLRDELDKTLDEIKRDYQTAVSFFNKNETKEKKP